MKERIGLGLLVAFIVYWALAGLRSPQPSEPINLHVWGGLPVLDGGRVRPLDTVARINLMLFRGKQSVKSAEGSKLTALQWLWRVVHQTDDAKDLPVFRIDDPDLVSLLGYEPESKRYFSYGELKPHLAELDRQFRQIDPDSLSRYDRSIQKLWENVARYQALATSLQPLDSTTPLATEVERYQSLVQAGTQNNELVRAFAARYNSWNSPLSLKVIPVQGEGNEVWRSIWETLVLHGGHDVEDPVLSAHIRLADAGATGDPQQFNDALFELVKQLGHERTSSLGFELAFNHYQPFYRSMVLYVLTFLLVCIYWIRPQPGWRKAAFICLLGAFLIQTGGLIARMLIHGRPPVTNLYSSAVFIGWGVALLSLALERTHRNGMGSSVAALVGFTTLLIAHHLSIGSDTMGSMQAVLNDNFWLSTHVVTITLGYSASFMAGFIALVYLFRAILSSGVDEKSAVSAERTVFGVLCFTLLFSFVGTVLGGVWADQSWGRFWGWDPKENGALLIVIWNAMILHLYIGRIIRRRGLMVLAVSGNIITSWSWFGVNMLGVGLHSYGFMDTAFVWLMVFWASQMFAMSFALAVPKVHWRSQQALDTARKNC